MFLNLITAWQYLVLEVHRRLRAWTRPTSHSLILGVVSDLARSKPELIAENALLRQQLIVLRRSVKRPQLTRRDRLLLVFLASKVRSWKNALLIVRPETLLRWHRALFRLYWWRKSAPKSRQSRIPEATVALIRQMAQENRLWGAERIRGELLKLGIRVSKRTVQKYMARVERRPPSAQTWKTFLQNHAHDIWVCDFLQVYDLFFRSLFVFILIELGSRRVAHVRVTSNPTDSWVAQQLREATAWGEGPKYLIRDQDSKYGIRFERVAAGRNIEEIKLPYRSPNLNAVCERFWESMRRESLDHLLILNERHLQRIVADYTAYFNRARPHQGIGQRIPDPPEATGRAEGKIVVTPILGGLHHDYRRAA